MPGSITRRRLLRTVAAGAATTGMASNVLANEPERTNVGLTADADFDVARSRADAVARELDFGAVGKAVVGDFSADALDALREHAQVRYVEDDGRVYAQSQTLPWGVDRVDADQAHVNDETGDGAELAVLDTGIDDDHPDLQANVGKGYAVEVCRGRGCNYDWSDDNDHGTHVSGTADAIDNSRGVVGVSTQATLHAVKVLDENGAGTYSGVAEGLKWVADQGYGVASMSFGGSSSSSVLKDAVEYAHANDVLQVASAGGSGPCTDCVAYPAKYNEVMAVSATNENDGLADFSSTGSQIEIAAPGTNTYSTVIGGYGTFSGTSMAAAHVSGAGAQLRANGYTATEARQQLLDTAEDLGLADNEQGHGLLDVEAALGLS